MNLSLIPFQLTLNLACERRQISRTNYKPKPEAISYKPKSSNPNSPNPKEAVPKDSPMMRFPKILKTIVKIQFHLFINQYLSHISECGPCPEPEGREGQSANLIFILLLLLHRNNFANLFQSGLKPALRKVDIFSVSKCLH